MIFLRFQDKNKKKNNQKKKKKIKIKKEKHAAGNSLLLGKICSINCYKNRTNYYLRLIWLNNIAKNFKYLRYINQIRGQIVTKYLFHDTIAIH